MILPGLLVYVVLRMTRLSPSLRASNEGLLRPRVARAQGTHRAILPCWRAFSASCWLHPLLVPEHGQRPLAENPVGARKTHNQRQHHREQEANAKYPWVYAPGKIEHIPQHSP